MLSHFYRELSVNLMMQVIRGGRLEGGEYLARSTERSLRASRRATASRRARRSRRHIESGRRIALDAVERAGGAL